MVLESNLMILFAVLGALLLLGVVGRALWPSSGRRIWQHCVAWWERDARAEREAKLLRAARVRAEAEMRQSLHDTDEAVTETNATPQMRIVKEMNATQIALRYDPNAKYESGETPVAPTMAEIDRSETARRIRPRLSEESRKILRN